MTRTARQQMRLTRLTRQFSERADEVCQSLLGATDAIARGALQEALEYARMAETGAEHMSAAYRDVVEEIIDTAEAPSQASS